MSSGWVILDKPSGLFSRKADAIVARIFGAKKYGHIGTLDEMASGVLPIALGAATKMIPFNQIKNEKEYAFSLRFGFETNTLDMTGQVVKRTNIIPTEKQILKILPLLTGDIKQIPPDFSSVHINGQRAYTLARKGKNLKLPAKKIYIKSLKLIKISGDSCLFKVSCSCGTYVRSIVRDIAKLCGSLATAETIRRIKTGIFNIKDSVGLDFLENLFNNDADFEQYLKPIDFGLGGIPASNLSEESARTYKNGGFVKAGATRGLRRVYSDGVFIGIGITQNGLLKPKRNV